MMRLIQSLLKTGLITNMRFLPVLAIILIGVILRGLNGVEKLDFAHDADLYSWIVKDVVVNHHIRLIGQESSTQGIFIGPLFYYLLIPFFLVTSMDPLGVLFFSLVLAGLTLFSFYFVFTKLFDKLTGIISLILQAFLPARIGLDRWVVPTITSSLWEVWYFYTVVNLLRGNFIVFPLLGLLVGLIWHINLSLAPSLLAVPVAIILSKKLPNPKQIGLSVLGFIIPSFPLFLFEARHNFSQTQAFINSFSADLGGPSGLYKLTQVIDHISENVGLLFFHPLHLPFKFNAVFLIVLVILGLLLTVKKALSGDLLKVMTAWFLGMVMYFSLSSKIISEYYFNNLNIIFWSIAILAINFYLKKAKKANFILMLIFLGLLIRAFVFSLQEGGNLAGYKYRKALAEFVTVDSKIRGYPCISVSYITTPGENVGFRYFFYLKNLHVNQPKSGSPDYTIVIPAGLYGINPDYTFGRIGLITPKKEFKEEDVLISCSGQNSNLTDPMLGFTN